LLVNCEELAPFLLYVKESVKRLPDD